MKLKKIILVSILLLVTLSLGVVCASDCQTSDLDSMGENMNNIQLESSDDILTDEIQALNIDDIKLTALNEDIGETEESSSEDNIISESETHSLGESDSVNVHVQNVFKGQKASIYVTAPKATGFVNITIGDKTYAPEFLNGVATQIISEYNIGLNNVTVKYNDVVKETSFKVLDGIITYDNFYDYFEKVINKEYCVRLRSFIPIGITLDFRGTFYFEHDISYICIDRPINLTSSTKDAIIDVYTVLIENTADESNISNFKFRDSLIISSSKCTVANSTAQYISCSDTGFRLVNSILHQNLHIVSNSTIINCTFNKKLDLSIHEGLNNVSIVNSTFNDGILMSATYMWMNPISDISIVNCIITGKTELVHVKNSLIENCSFNNGFLSLMTENMTIRNNFFNVTSSDYAIDLRSTDYEYNKIIGNIIYSKDYCGNDAISYPKFKQLLNTFENNTPIQKDLNISITSGTIFYDENTTVMVNIQGVEGNVAFYVNGEKISSVELVNGTATQIIDKYAVGINNITVVYEDLINSIHAINRTSVNVNKVRYCPINLVHENVSEGKTSVVSVILPDDANGTILLKLYNDIYSVSVKQDANGSYNLINIPPLFEGNYTLSTVFNSIKYVTNSTIGYLNVVHIPVYNLTASALVMDYKDGSKYKVLVTKDGKAVGMGEVVKITFNGKTVEVKTDKDGYATLTLDAAPKTYTIKAEYNGVTKSTKVSIKNILKAGNVSKKKAKQIKFSATLKTSKGKAIVGKKITFKFKGKTYSAKTNKKGVATITLKNLKVGKYSITSKYGTCTVKNTIKIKK